MGARSTAASRAAEVRAERAARIAAREAQVHALLLDYYTAADTAVDAVDAAQRRCVEIMAAARAKAAACRTDAARAVIGLRDLGESRADIAEATALSTEELRELLELGTRTQTSARTETGAEPHPSPGRDPAPPGAGLGVPSPEIRSHTPSGGTMNGSARPRAGASPDAEVGGAPKGGDGDVIPTGTPGSATTDPDACGDVARSAPTGGCPPGGTRNAGPAGDAQVAPCATGVAECSIAPETPGSVVRSFFDDVFARVGSDGALPRGDRGRHLPSGDLAVDPTPVGNGEHQVLPEELQDRHLRGTPLAGGDAPGTPRAPRAETRSGAPAFAVDRQARIVRLPSPGVGGSEGGPARPGPTAPRATSPETHPLGSSSAHAPVRDNGSRTSSHAAPGWQDWEWRG